MLQNLTPKEEGFMKVRGKDLYLYSVAFRKRVIMSIETGEYNILQASEVFGCSPSTIYKWIRKYGKNYQIGKVIKVSTKSERDRIKELESEVKFLREERDYGKLKVLAFETLIEVANQEMNIDLKKNFGCQASKRQSQKLNNLITTKNQ